MTRMTLKPLAIAAFATAAAAVVLPARAHAGDPALGALFGATLGAAIGHNVNGRHGAVVGGVLGAMTGASIAAGSGYYHDPYYGAPPVTHYRPAPVYYVPRPYYRPAPVYYAPRPYYRPAPVYYAPPRVVVRTRPVHVYNAYPHRPAYTPVHGDRRHDGRRGG